MNPPSSPTARTTPKSGRRRQQEIVLSEEFLAPFAERQPAWGSLGWITYKRTYARWADKAKTRREEWWETVRRVVEGNINMDPRPRTPEVVAELEAEAKEMFETIFTLAWTPPGRGLWISGTDYAKRVGDALINCWFIDVVPRPYEEGEAAKPSYPFCFAMDRLMAGGGVGFGVTIDNVLQFPPVSNPVSLSVVCDPHHANYRELNADQIPLATHTTVRVEDSREGWVDALRVLIDAHFKAKRVRHLVIDVSDVRPAGADIKGFGGTSAGPGPLVELLRSANGVLNDRVGVNLTPVDCTDLMNMVGRSVVAGNVRRSAEIGLGSANDLGFISMKQDQAKLMSHRWASNNSVVIDGSFEDFDRIATAIAVNGEPGIFNIDLARNRLRLCDDASDERNLTVGGTNPCVTGDTWVLTDGGPKRVEDLVGRAHRSVVDGVAHETTDAGFWSTGRQAVLHLATREGYQLRLTDNHRILRVSRQTPKIEELEWVEAGSLEPGDKIKLDDHRSLTGWDGEGNFAEGWLLGELIGDGTFSDRTAYLDFWGDQAEEMAAQAVELVHATVGGRSDLTGHRVRAGKMRVGSSRLRDLAARYGVVRGNQTITDAMHRTSSAFHRGLLRGLFDADGSVQGTQVKGVSVRLSQSDLPLLRAAQQMLLRLGIASTINENRRDAGEQVLPDGRGGHAVFSCRADHELVIARDNIVRFAQEVGFADTAKRARLAALIAGYRRAFNRERFTATVSSVIPDGVAEVFDCTVPATSRFGANGIAAHNCGEIVLDGAGESCNLAEVFPAVIEREGLDMERILRLALRYTKRVTCARYTWPASAEIVERNRRVGVSLSGIRDWMLARGVRDLEDVAGELDAWYGIVRDEDRMYSEVLGIPTSVAVSTVKPSGCRPWNALTSTNRGILTLEELFAGHPDGAQWADLDEPAEALQGGASSRITRTYDNGAAPVLRITTSFGIQVESTPNHRWWVRGRYGRATKARHTEVGEWVEAASLRPGDILEIIPGAYSSERHSPLSSVASRALKMRGDAAEIRQPSEMNPDLAWLLGYLWGDGAMSPNRYRIRFIDGRMDNLEKAKRIVADQFGLDAEIRKASGARNACCLEVASKHLWHWLIRNDVFKYFGEGHQIDLIPAVVRSSAHEDQLAFLAGLIDADGCVSARPEENIVILSTADEAFAKHVQQVALALGLVFNRNRINGHGAGRFSREPIWNMTLMKMTLAGRFTILEHHSVKMRPENKRRPELPWSHLRSSGKHILGKVESIEDAGVMPTFDIEVDGTHWYYAGAIKSHNTVSLLNGSSPGLHAHQGRYYIRRIRLSAKDALVDLIRQCGFHVEDDAYSPNTVVAEFPVKAPGADADGFVTAGELSLEEQFATQATLQRWWSDNAVSATLTFRKEERRRIPGLLREYRDQIKSTSLLPYTGEGETTTYVQMPYEPITRERYEEMLAQIICWPHEVAGELHEMRRQEFDIVDQADCAGGACPIK